MHRNKYEVAFHGLGFFSAKLVIVHSMCLHGFSMKWKATFYSRVHISLSVFSSLSLHFHCKYMLFSSSSCFPQAIEEDLYEEENWLTTARQEGHSVT